jgi:hypothetical protein
MIFIAIAESNSMLVYCTIVNDDGPSKSCGGCCSGFWYQLLFSLPRLAASKGSCAS